MNAITNLQVGEREIVCEVYALNRSSIHDLLRDIYEAGIAEGVDICKNGGTNE